MFKSKKKKKKKLLKIISEALIQVQAVFFNKSSPNGPYFDSGH